MRLACSGPLSSFAREAAIVTPSADLAAIAAEQFRSEQLSQGRETWPQPSIHSVGAWLATCWQGARYRSTDIPTLLSPAQERALWERVIEEDNREAGRAAVFDISALARLASGAARVLAEWRIPSDGELWQEHVDARQFQHWHRLFRRVCQERNWISRADLWRLVPVWIERGWHVPGPTVFVAFPHIPPALERIRQALQQRSSIRPLCSTTADKSTPIRQFVDFAQEIEHAARLTRARFEQDPATSIGVLVPNLADQRALVARVFDQVFYPAGQPETKAFHLNARRPLETEPVIAGALLLLELGFPLINHARAGAILRSPFLTGASAERNIRALADVDLRRRRELDVSLRDIEYASRNCPLLAALWPRLRAILGRARQTQELAEWSSFFSDLLKLAGWPGERTPSGEEQRSIDSWNDALSELATLGLISPPVSFAAALAQLRRLLSASAGYGDWSAPVQILDSSAPGVEFDCAILTGLSEETWPPPLRLPALIPMRLLRLHQVPASGPQSIREERNKKTELLFSSAREQYASYSGRLAAIVEPYVSRDLVEEPVWTGRRPRESYSKAALEMKDDAQAPLLPPSEGVRGGASVIKAQSQCPFKAFAEYRLNARAPEDACFGFDARDRGGFLHKALENVWKRLTSQAALRSASNEELRVIVQTSVEEALAGNQAAHDPGPLHRLARRAEQERLETLLMDWLSIERDRKQPFTVETVEQERYFEIPGLRLRLRIDRIDRLANGKLLLIDYKSGQQSRNKLKLPRPQEPQLLMYAASIGEEVDGVFFGEIKARDQRAVGIAREAHFPGRSVDKLGADWDSFLEDSRHEIERLAVQFVSGYAIVDPLKGACSYCQVKPFCRISESGIQVEEDD